MYHRRVLVLAALFVMVVSPCPSRGEVPFGQLLSRVPGDANALIMIDVQKIRASEFVRQLGALKKPAEARSHGVEAAPFRADIADPDRVAGLFSSFRGELGPLDLLVNSAGIWKRAPIGEMSPDQLEETLAVNLKGTVYCCREAALAFAGRPGVIVNILRICVL